MDWIARLQGCFSEERVLYSRHARNEMRQDEFGAISDQELGEAIGAAEVVQTYPDETLSERPGARAYGERSTTSCRMRLYRIGRSRHRDHSLSARSQALARRSPPEEMMICVICHGEQIEVQEVREELEIATDIVWVPTRVPVCGTCGERYYDRPTLRYLEQVEKALRAGSGKTREIGRVLKYG